MRVLFLTKYTATGPSSRYRVVQFLPFLDARNIAYDVHSLHDEHYLTERYAGRPTTPWYLARRVAARLASLLHARAYDVVFIQKELFPHALDVPELALSMAGIPTIVDLDDAIHLFYQDAAGWKRPLRDKIPRVLSRASLVLAGNRYLEEYARRFSRHVQFFPTVVDTDRVIAGGPPAARRPVVGWMGTPETVRYLHDLAPVLEDVAQQTPIELFVVGAEAPALAGVPAHSKPWREAEEVADLHRMDIGVMPLADDEWSRGKCSLKLLQYMSAGVASVSSPRGSAGEIVRDGENAILADTPAEWREALIALAGSAESRRNMGEKARNRVVADYSLKVWGPRFVAAIEQAASERPRAGRVARG
ncbi:MAG TPA: glycosyltransferase family 4 protein [Candidatus Krumholzibacteria bacterium]|nr:glycosyltransferase family 4 protein [Candidatus Krumholzibacteria bacterium]